MKLRLLNEREVERLLDMASCIDLMEAALCALSRGDAIVPLRNKVMLPDGAGLLGMMPGYLGDPRSFGLKVVTVFHKNHEVGLPSHQGVVMLFDVATGAPLGLFDAAAITAIRTAAASGAATRALAREDAGDLALLGSDQPQYVSPSNLKGAVHDFALLYLGIHLFDNLDLEALGEAAASRNRYEFLLTASPLPIKGGTGSPLNPIATF